MNANENPQVDEELMRPEPYNLNSNIEEIATVCELGDFSTPKIVLVVEDDDVSLLLLTKCLQKIGCQVLQAKNGKEAFELLQTQLPELILLDSAMPVMNGAKFRQLQLREARFSQIPTVLVSAIDDAERKKGILAGLHFLAKPVSIDHLISTVKYFMGTTTPSQVL